MVVVQQTGDGELRPTATAAVVAFWQQLGGKRVCVRQLGGHQWIAGQRADASSAVAGALDA